MADPDTPSSEDHPEEARDAEAPLRQRLRQFREVYEGIYVAPYRSAIYREYLRQRDVFLLVAFADLLGVPNPVAFYTLEIYPELIEQFHEWHLRLAHLGFGLRYVALRTTGSPASHMERCIFKIS